MTRAETITSSENPLLKDVKRALARGELTSQGCCVAETFHLLEEALRSRCEIPAVLASESAQSTVETLLRQSPDARLVILPDALLQRLGGTETSQGVISLVKPPTWTVDDLFRGRPLVVVLDGLQDPGNAGAIVRAAEAFGATGALFLKGAVSPYNSKTLRASAGSLFRLPFRHGVDTEEALGVLQGNRLALYAAVPGTTRLLSDVDLAVPCGLIIGSEAHGVGPVMRRAAQEVSIPTLAVESLNAAVAAGILLYEARRQRVLRP